MYSAVKYATFSITQCLSCLGTLIIPVLNIRVITDTRILSNLCPLQETSNSLGGQRIYVSSINVDISLPVKSLMICSSGLPQSLFIYGTYVSVHVPLFFKKKERKEINSIPCISTRNQNHPILQTFSQIFVPHTYVDRIE